MGKLSTPAWILEGYKSEEEYNKKKGIKTEKKEKGIFKLRLCPKCGSDEVNIALGKEKNREWQCKKCKWTGINVKEKKVTEEEFMEYLDKKGEALPSDKELEGDFKKVIEGSDEEDVGEEE